MGNERRLFTSESVAAGHPDKVADQISDSILDAIIAQDPMARVACETLVTTGMAVVAGEITTNAKVEYADVVRNTIRSIGYTDPALGFSADEAAVLITLRKQAPAIDQKGIEKAVRNDLIPAVLEREKKAHLLDKKTKFFVNPTGRFVVGGPKGDCGLTGRKIIVDSYGGMGRHGGGAFSGKDPTKVDRSACYMARYIAKNVVAAGLAERVEIQLAYAIGVADLVSVSVDTFGSGKIDQNKISELIRENFHLTPRGIIESLDLRRPIYKKTASYGHFGRNEPEFSWERTDKAAKLKTQAGI